MQGRLGYNSDNDRYGVLAAADWLYEGFHCGEPLEVLIDGAWVQSRMEMKFGENGGVWYLVGTPYEGKDLEYLTVCIRE